MTPQTQILDDPLFDGYDLGDFLPITQHFVPSDEGYENDTDLESESEVAPLFTQDSKGLDRFERPPSLFTCLKIHQDDELGFLPMEGKATATASLSHSTESFCDLPVYIEHTSNAEDIQSLKRFDKKLFNLVEFLVHAAKETTIKDITSHSSWVNLPFKQPLRHSNTVVICQIFQRAIPESSRVILGQAEITSDHLLSLPLVDESCKSTVGVYINCAVGIPSGHRKNQESDLPTSFEECQIMTPIANIPESTESDHIAIYAGSSTADLEDRVRHQERAIEIIRTGKRPYHHQVVQENGLTSNFRMLAIFQPSLPDLGLAFADSGWLIRLLEMVVIMLLDAYLPPDPDSFRTRYGIGKEEYFNALDSCGIHRSKFRPLNKAFPTKQSVKDHSRSRNCRNCQARQTLNWYYDPYHSNVALSFLCRTCYCYWFRLGMDRPSFLFNQQSPQNGPCSNCKATTSSRWRLHLKTQGLILCNCCYMWMWDYGEDRPREVWIRQRDGKFCIKCGSTATRKWKPIRHFSGQATGDYQCASCSKRQQIEEDNLIRRLGCYRCHLCGTTDSPEWPSPRTCQSCHDNKNLDNDLKRRRERRTCMNCHIEFGGKVKRQWNAQLKQWFCNACEKGISEHGCFRVTAIHLTGLAIRCEACNALWAERWRLFAKDPIGNKSHGRVLCGRCFAKCEKTPAKVETPGAINFGDRSQYEPRFGSVLKDIKFQDMMNKRKRLCQNHILVEYLERKHGIVLKIEMMLEIRIQKHVDLLWARQSGS